MFGLRDVNSESVKSTLSHKLSLKIGTSRQYSYADVEDLTGIKARTVKSYCEGEVLIPLHNFVKISCAIDSSNILNAPFELVGFGGLHRVVGQGRTPHQMLARIGEAVSMKARHLDDGRLDHNEKAEQKSELRILASELLAYSESL